MDRRQDRLAAEGKVTDRAVDAHLPRRRFRRHLRPALFRNPRQGPARQHRPQDRSARPGGLRHDRRRRNPLSRVPARCLEPEPNRQRPNRSTVRFSASRKPRAQTTRPGAAPAALSSRGVQILRGRASAKDSMARSFHQSYYICAIVMPPPMNMNSFEGKRILALIRDGDYAHAGEEEAIERSFRSIPKRPGSWMLDVGCGRGGSAEYLRRHGWGRVEGIDRDGDSIEYARANWPEAGFHVCDVLDLPRSVTRTFDVIYMLNAFYAFAHQRDALAAIRKVAGPRAQLVIFDYSIGAGA